MPCKKYLSALTALLVLGFGGLQGAAAQSFPTRPIQLVIPFQPGDTDSMLRPFAEKMGEFLGQPVVLSYKPGAGGGVGAAFVAISKADGYTLVGSSPGSLVVVPLANKEFQYTTESFAPVAALAEGGLLLVAASSPPWKSVEDLVAQAKRDPGKVTYGSSGARGITHLLAEIFAKDAQIELNHIPFQGSGPAITALLGGHIDMASTAIAPAQAHIRAGTLRPLATFGDTRLKAFPAVPTLKEAGFNVGSPTLYGIAAPQGTPPEIVDAIYAAAKKATDAYNPQIADNLALLGAQIRLLGPKEYSDI